MKIVELINNIKIPITNEENELLNQFEGQEPIYKNSLSERQQLLANQLVNKDILTRRIQDGKVLFKKKIS
jgi:hypothetical protein